MTAQIHENLILDGKKTSMAFCPPLPENHPRIAEVDLSTLRTAADEDWFVGTTACWRGYLGTWEIRDDRFSLLELRGRYRLTGKGPLFADWFTGVLRIPQGKLLEYVHMGFGSVYEREHHVEVEKGVVTRRGVLDNRGKTFDRDRLAWENLPGGENHFAGDEVRDSDEEGS